MCWRSDSLSGPVAVGLRISVTRPPKRRQPASFCGGGDLAARRHRRRRRPLDVCVWAGSHVKTIDAIHLFALRSIRPNMLALDLGTSRTAHHLYASSCWVPLVAVMMTAQLARRPTGLATVRARVPTCPTQLSITPASGVEKSINLFGEDNARACASIVSIGNGRVRASAALVSPERRVFGQNMKNDGK